MYFNTRKNEQDQTGGMRLLSRQENKAPECRRHARRLAHLSPVVTAATAPTGEGPGQGGPGGAHGHRAPTRSATPLALPPQAGGKGQETEDLHGEGTTHLQITRRGLAPTEPGVQRERSF